MELSMAGSTAQPAIGGTLVSDDLAPVTNIMRQRLDRSMYVELHR